MKTIEEIIAFIRGLANDKTEILPNWNEIADQLSFEHMRLLNKESNLEEQLKKLKSELGEAAKWTRAELSRELAMNVELNNNLREENGRLMVALKPVLDCYIMKFKHGYETQAVDPFFTSATIGVEDADGDGIDDESIATALNAVRKAQTICNGGEK